MRNRTPMIDVWEIDLTTNDSTQTILRQILARYVRTSAEELVIERGEFGKPYLLYFPEWQFNLSHSGEKLLIAVSYEIPVGVDIEQIKPRRSLAGLVKKCFAVSEQNYWFGLPEHERLNVFYEFWTRKEAVVKGIGRGIVLGLNRCEIDTAQPEHFLSLPVNETWRTYQLEQDQNYCASIAINRNDVALRHRKWRNSL